MSAQPSSAETGMTLVEHLTELRKRLIICVAAVGIGMIIAFFAYDWIFNFLIDPYKDIATERERPRRRPPAADRSRSRASACGSRPRATPASPWPCRSCCGRSGAS